MIAQQRVGLFWEFIVIVCPTAVCVLVRVRWLIREFKFFLSLVPKLTEFLLYHAVTLFVHSVIVMPDKRKTIPQNEVAHEV